MLPNVFDLDNYIIDIRTHSLYHKVLFFSMNIKKSIDTYRIRVKINIRQKGAMK